MDDFAKTKTAFAAGLLALLFTAWPVLQDTLGSSFRLFGLELTLKAVYATVTIALSISVYATGLRLLTQTALRSLEFVANATYALALVIPPAVGVLFVIATAADLVAPIVDPPGTIDLLTNIASVIAGAVSTLAFVRTTRTFQRRAVESQVALLEKHETTEFARAEELSRNEHYDLAVIDAYKSLESAAKKRLLAIGKLHFGPRVESPLKAAVRTGLIPSELQADLQFVQARRNMAAHSVEPTSKSDAESVLARSGRILAALTGPDDDTRAG
jgi:hypothetical protein